MCLFSKIKLRDIGGVYLMMTSDRIAEIEPIIGPRKTPGPVRIQKVDGPGWHFRFQYRSLGATFPSLLQTS